MVVAENPAWKLVTGSFCWHSCQYPQLRTSESPLLQCPLIMDEENFFHRWFCRKFHIGTFGTCQLPRPHRPRVSASPCFSFVEALNTSEGVILLQFSLGFLPFPHPLLLLRKVYNQVKELYQDPNQALYTCILELLSGF